MSIKKSLVHLLIISISIAYSFATGEFLIDYFKSFLQKNVSNKDFMNVVETLRKLTPQVYPENLDHNIRAFPIHFPQIESNKGFIEDQWMYSDMLYGMEKFSQNGCEIIAVYNALYDLTGEEDRNLPEMIDYFEKDDNGILLYGLFGTAPKAPEEYLNKLGFKTKSSTEKEDYLDIQESCDSYILTIYNDIEDIMNMIHTVSITKKNGKFYVHNNGYYGYTNGYDSILDILEKINNGKSKDIYLIGIKKN